MARASSMDATQISGLDRRLAEASSSGRRYFSWLPTTRSMPGLRARASGFVWARQPVTTTSASGLAKRSRWILNSGSELGIG